MGIFEHLIPLCAGNGIQMEIEIHKDINPHFSFGERDKRKFVKKSFFF
jgi:hypothetical protein